MTLESLRNFSSVTLNRSHNRKRNLLKRSFINQSVLQPSSSGRLKKIIKSNKDKFICMSVHVFSIHFEIPKVVLVFYIGHGLVFCLEAVGESSQW